MSASKQRQKRARRSSAAGSRRRANPTVARAIEDYLLDHEGGNHSPKTLEWHRTALRLMRTYFGAERGVTMVGKVEASDINVWFAHTRKSPGGHGKPRSERTIQTYARPACAFFHWLVCRETIDRSPFDHVVFPKVGKPLIHTIDAEEFERLLLACAPPSPKQPSPSECGQPSNTLTSREKSTGNGR
jgi:site-specific recombinase XerD